MEGNENIQAADPAGQSKLTSLRTAVQAATTDLAKETGIIAKGFTAAAAFEEKLISSNRQLGLTVNFTRSVQKELAQAAINTLYMGGNLEDVIVSFEKLNKDLERTSYFSTDFLSNITAVKKFGVGDETISTFVKFFDKVGGGMDQAMGQTIQLVKTAQDYGLNTGKFVQDVASQMDKLNKYGFPKGVEDLASMVAKSKILGDTLSVAQGFADQIMDSPEKAYEYAAQLQTLGGSFSQLGDGAQLLYMAQNDLKGLQDQIINATRGIATFNETTGQFQISANERLRLRQLKNLNLDVEKIEETALKLAKQEKIIQELNFSPTFKGLGDEEKELIANYAQITQGGKVEIKGQVIQKGQEFNFRDIINQLRPGEKDQLQNNAEKNRQVIENNLSANETLQLSINKLNNSFAVGILKQDQLQKSFEGLTAAASTVTENFNKLVTRTSVKTNEGLGNVSTSTFGSMFTNAISAMTQSINSLIAGKPEATEDVFKYKLDVTVNGIDLKLAETIKTTIATEVATQLSNRGYSSGTATR